MDIGSIVALVVIGVVLLTAGRVILGGNRGASGPPYVSTGVVIIIVLAVLTALYIFVLPQIHITIGP